MTPQEKRSATIAARQARNREAKIAVDAERAIRKANMRAVAQAHIDRMGEMQVDRLRAELMLKQRVLQMFNTTKEKFTVLRVTALQAEIAILEEKIKLCEVK